MVSTTPSRAKPLTPKQAEVMDYLRKRIADHGISPTMQEVGDRFGLSKVSIFEHINGHG